MKRMIRITISLIITAVFVSGCVSSVNAPVTVEQENQEAAETPETVKEPPEQEVKKLHKIGIVSGAAEQFPEEYNAALRMKEKYGDMIEISLYPDMSEPKADALALNMRALADGGAEAIVICPGVEGTAEAMNRVLDLYPDMFFICGEASEEAVLIAACADIVMKADSAGIAKSIIIQARKMGAKVFVHYTFARHMGVPELSERRDMLMEACEEQGLQFVDATIPDPEEEGGPAASISFVQEDVPKMVSNYGKDTAFYSTEETVQETLINSVLWEGALFPATCVESPFYAYPDAFGIDIPFDKKDDATYLFEEIKKTIIAKGGEGRFSTWALSLNPFFIEAGTEYAVGFLNGNILSRNETDSLKKICETLAGGSAIELSNCVAPSGMTLLNYYFTLSNFIDF